MLFPIAKLEPAKLEVSVFCVGAPDEELDELPCPDEFDPPKKEDEDEDENPGPVTRGLGLAVSTLLLIWWIAKGKHLEGLCGFKNRGKELTSRASPTCPLTIRACTRSRVTSITGRRASTRR